jgi:hypothetical protein
MSDTESCASCRKPKANFECEICQEQFCKKCSQILDQSTFKYLAELPEELKHSIYCGHCYDTSVAPALQRYEETIENAKQVFVFYNTSRRDPPHMKRSRLRHEVHECDDRDETIFRLAFFAAEAGFNAITDVDLKSKKITNNGAYQKFIWSGTSIPAMVDSDRMDLQDRVDQIYR